MSIPTPSHASPLSLVTEEDLKVEEANLSIILDRYKDRFKDLPKEMSWRGKYMYLYQGYWYSSTGIFSLGSVLASQDAFQANSTDLYLATLPKSGTTWLKALVFATLNRTKYKNNSHPLLISNPHDCVTYIENEILRNKPTYNVDSNTQRLFATHMPYNALPKSIFDSGCRLVYMCRNPKDVLISTFHFLNKLRDKSLGVLTFEEAFEMFSKGIMARGPYWDHVKEYYKASLENPQKVLFLTYENTQMDTISNVKRLAGFLGHPFTKEEEAKGVVEEIVSLCCFKNLSEHNKHGNISDGVPNEAFFRKGKVGDWSNYLTDDMSKILDQITKEKFHGLDISF